MLLAFGSSIICAVYALKLILYWLIQEHEMCNDLELDGDENERRNFDLDLVPLFLFVLILDI